jgi:hypothetical protein
LRDIPGVREYTIKEEDNNIIIVRSGTGVEYTFTQVVSTGKIASNLVYEYTCTQDGVIYNIFVKILKDDNNTKEKEVYKLFKEKEVEFYLEMYFPTEKITVCDKYDGTLKEISPEIKKLNQKMRAHCTKFILKQIFSSILIALEKEIGFYTNVNLNNILFKCGRNSFRVFLTDINYYTKEYSLNTLNLLIINTRTFIRSMYSDVKNICEQFGEISDKHKIKDDEIESATDKNNIYKRFKNYTDEIIGALNDLIVLQETSQ